jgi:hypothetical protein
LLKTAVFCAQNKNTFENKRLFVSSFKAAESGGCFYCRICPIPGPGVIFRISLPTANAEMSSPVEISAKRPGAIFFMLG